MHCPFCAHPDTKVNDSRLAAEGSQIRRRRECLACGERFTTFETAELVMPLVVKSDHRRVPFDESKLRSGMLKALEKRPVSREKSGDSNDRRENDERASIANGVQVADAVEHDAEQTRAESCCGGSNDQAKYHGP